MNLNMMFLHYKYGIMPHMLNITGHGWVYLRYLNPRVVKNLFSLGYNIDFFSPISIPSIFPIPVNDYAKTALFPIILLFNFTTYIQPALFPMFFMGDLWPNALYTGSTPRVNSTRSIPVLINFTKLTMRLNFHATLCELFQKLNSVI